MVFTHTPAMASEVVEFLNVRPGKTYVDCTLGGAGHARRIVERMAPGGFLVGIDQDRDAIENARKVLGPHMSDIALVHDNFANVGSALVRLGIEKVDGILVDLGVSFHQIGESGRGFTFQKDEPLDMRMNEDSEGTAADIVNRCGEKELADIFFRYGEERWSRRIAGNIVEARKAGLIESTFSLKEIVERSIPKKAQYKQGRKKQGRMNQGEDRQVRIHPATKVFMALRIAVNRELEVLEKFMDSVADLLHPGGRLCVLSFHSLEDRIVKHRIRALEKGCTCPGSFPVCVCGFEQKLRSLTPKPIRPTREEIEANPMARSTRLRAAERV